jgi:hypothetical protein
MSVLQNVECISGLGIIVFYVTYVFPVPNCEVSIGLAYIRLVACFTSHFVYAVFVVILCGILEFGFDQLLQNVCTFKGYFYVNLFEEVGNHSDFGAVISEGGPFIVVIVVGFVHLGFTLCLCSQSGYVVNGEFIVVYYGSYILPFCYSLFS